jgi:hypothetical protein
VESAAAATASATAAAAESMPVLEARLFPNRRAAAACRVEAIAFQPHARRLSNLASYDSRHFAAKEAKYRETNPTYVKVSYCIIHANPIGRRLHQRDERLLPCFASTGWGREWSRWGACRRQT